MVVVIRVGGSSNRRRRRIPPDDLCGSGGEWEIIMWLRMSGVELSIVSRDVRFRVFQPHPTFVITRSGSSSIRRRGRIEIRIIHILDWLLPDEGGSFPYSIKEQLIGVTATMNIMSLLSGTRDGRRGEGGETN